MRLSDGEMHTDKTRSAWVAVAESDAARTSAVYVRGKADDGQTPTPAMTRLSQPKAAWFGSIVP